MATRNNGRESARASGPEYFDLGKLPRELRDKIWEEAFEAFLPAADPHRQKSPVWGVQRPGLRFTGYGTLDRDTNYQFWLAEGNDLTVHTRQSPPLRSVCREANQVFVWRYRNTKQGSDKHRVWEYQYTVPMVHKICEKRSDSLMPILPPSSMPLVLSLDDDLSPMSRPPVNYVSPLGSRRVLDLVLAAGDDQIKLMSSDMKRFCLPNLPSDPPLPVAAKAWLDRHEGAPVCVSVKDMVLWRDLQNMAKFYGLEWPFADRIVKGGSPSIVREAVAPLQKTWVRENRRRLKETGEGLRPLPVMDVVVCVSMTHGVPRWMSGFGVPDETGYNDMVRWGVL